MRLFESHRLFALEDTLTAQSLNFTERLFEKRGKSGELFVELSGQAFNFFRSLGVHASGF